LQHGDYLKKTKQNKKMTILIYKKKLKNKKKFLIFLKVLSKNKQWLSHGFFILRPF